MSYFKSYKVFETDVYFKHRHEFFQTYLGRYMFDITLAYKLINAKKIAFKVKEYSIDHLVHFAHEHFVSIDKDHLKVSHLNIEKPIGILVKVRDPETREDEWHLIDGNHRVTKAAQEHFKTAKVYQIDNVEETAKIVKFDLTIPKKLYSDD